VELSEVIRKRRMIRSFAVEPVDPELVDRLLAAALRAPSAGNTRGVAWLVLTGAETATYWEHTSTPEWREAYGRRFAGMARAPVVALSLCSPAAYVNRYGEPDKLGSGLGPTELGEGGEAAWPVPFWFGDAAFSTMLLLLGAVDAGLAAAFLGAFRGPGLLGALGVPDDWRLFGAVLLGRPDGHDTPSPSLGRRPKPGAGAVHRSRW
jgi:nitroreductase